LLDSAVSPCYFYCFRCLGAFRRGRTLELSRISVCNGPSAITKPYFLAWWSFNCSGERSFPEFKKIKNELKGRNIPGEVVHTKHSVY